MSEVYLRTKQLRIRYGSVSHMWVERRLQDDPSFPRPVKMGRLRFWKLSELEAWEAAQAHNKPVVSLAFLAAEEVRTRKAKAKQA
jgi:predicted DNA-binding transcriptional regulator AlpA